MTVNYTTLLALGQPVTGTEAGTWGDDVNNAVTSYLDIAIAGTQTLSTDADVTLTKTQGTSSATNISSTSSQYMILNCTGSRTAIRNINTPNTSKAYIVINNTTGGFNVVIRGGTGPTTGISVAPGKQTWVAWDTNAGDFREIASGDVDGPASATDNAVARFDGTTGKIIQNSAVTIADSTGDITGGAYNKVTITAPASGSTLTIADGKTLTANRSLTLTGTDGTTQTFPSTNATIARTDAGQTFTGTNTFSSAPIVSTLTSSKPVFSDGSSALTSTGTLATDQGGTGQTSYTAGDILYFASGTAFTKLAIGGASTVLTSSGSVPQWTSLSGISVGTATNLAGGAAGSVPYQTASGATSFVAIGTAAQVLQVNSGATAPEWVSSTGTGNVVRATSPTLVTPTLGVATVTSVNKVAFTAPATSATLTLADGSTLATSGAYSLTFTTTGATNLTLPTSGTVATTGNTVSSLSFGTTGLTPNSATSGPVTVAGTLSPANGGTGVANNALNTLTFTGNYSLGFTLTGNTSVTLPNSGTLATLSGTETLTGKTINGSNNTITNVSLSSGVTGTLPIGNGGTGNTATPTNGQLLIGNGSGFSLATLTQGTGITITNSSGGITIAASGGGGSGTVTSVAQTFTGGIISVAGSPITTSGTLALTVAGTSGGIPYFSSGTAWASSAALAANAIVIGGGAGAAPSTTTTATGILTFLGTPSSANLAAAVTDETGSGSLVFATSPSLTTPTLGVASATSVNKVAITAPATSATLTLANGSTLATSGANSITLTSTGSTNVTLPTSGTLSTTGFAIAMALVFGG